MWAPHPILIDFDSWLPIAKAQAGKLPVLGGATAIHASIPADGRHALEDRQRLLSVAVLL